MNSMKRKSKTMTIIILGVIVLTFIFLFLVYQSRMQKVYVSGELEAIKSSFIIGTTPVAPNEEGGISQELMNSYDGKNVSAIGRWGIVTVGASTPDCELAQIGCKREFRTVILENITLLE
jgi:hypothetical protein